MALDDIKINWVCPLCSATFTTTESYSKVVAEAIRTIECQYCYSELDFDTDAVVLYA